MKWPFVRRSKYEQLLIYFKIINDEKDWHLEHNTQLSDENDSYFQEINRLNQELASELNNHRETKKNSDKLVEILRNDISTQQGMYEILELKNEELDCELEETKDALKIAQEETRQHRMTIDFADEKEEKIKQYLIKVINYI